MKKFFTIATVALMTLGFSAKAQEGTTWNIDPAPGTYEELPSTFTITVEGASLVKAAMLGGSNVLVGKPDGTSQTLSASTAVKYSGNTITITIPSSVDRTIAGDYTITIPKGTSMNGTRVEIEGGNPAINLEHSFGPYTVGGSGSGGGDVTPDDGSVKYDLTIASTKPGMDPFDLENKTWNPIQFVVSGGKYFVKDGAMVTIKGPDYYQTAALLFNFFNTWDNVTYTGTTFKATFIDPTYNGTYHLTIPQGVFGDEAWFEDNTKGHANAAIDITINTINGADPSAITIEHIFNPTVTPAPGVEVSSLDDVVLTFPSTVYGASSATLTVKYMKDRSATAFANFGTATLEKINDTQYKVIFTPQPTENADYQLILPSGAVWDADHDANANAGTVSGKCQWEWALYNGVVLEITSTQPKSDQTISTIDADFPIIVNTNDNDQVAKMTLKVLSYELGNDMASGKTVIASTTTTTKNEDGAIYYAPATAVNFTAENWYELTYTLYNEDGEELDGGIVEFYGDYTTGVNGIVVDAANAEVFNLQGVRINNANLPAGLYIINGKKTIVK